MSPSRKLARLRRRAKKTFHSAGDDEMEAVRSVFSSHHFLCDSFDSEIVDGFRTPAVPALF